MRKGIVVCLGMIIGFVLLLPEFLGPWYVIDMTGMLGADYHAGLFLTRMELQAHGQGIYVSMGYDEVKNYAQNIPMNIESFAVIDTAFFLTVLALVTAVLAIFFMGAFEFEKGKPKTMKYSGGLLAFLTFLLTLVPALYFMNTEFVKNSNGFWLKLSIFGMTVTGGPGYAWYLMLVVAGISVICAIAILLTKIPSEESSAEKTVPPESETVH